MLLSALGSTIWQTNRRMWYNQHKLSGIYFIYSRANSMKDFLIEPLSLDVICIFESATKGTNVRLPFFELVDILKQDDSSDCK